MPNEEGLDPGNNFNYRVFPKFNKHNFRRPRMIQNFNMEGIIEKIMGNLINNEQLQKMHDNEWARYMLELIYLLWFQVFCTALPIYISYSSNLIEFAKKMLNHVRIKVKPMRDIEFIYRRLF